MTTTKTTAAKKTRAKKPANGSVRVTQKGTGAKAVIAAAEATPDLMKTLSKPRRGPGRPRKTPEPTVVKTSEQIADDIEAEILKLKPILDAVAQMQQVADILRGKM